MENSKIKICHIANTDSAIKFLLLNQLKFFQQQNYDVSVVCSNGKFVKDIRGLGIKVETIEIKRKISPVSDLIYLFKLWRYLRKEKFALVHTHTPKPGFLGQIAAKFAGISVIINTIHGFYFMPEPLSLRGAQIPVIARSPAPFTKGAGRRGNLILSTKFYILIEKIAAKCSTLIFSQNQEDIQTAIKENICFAEKIKYLGNGIDLKKFDINRFSREFIINKKQELGISEHRKIIGIVGRLVQEKGYYDLFQAIKQVKEGVRAPVIARSEPAGEATRQSHPQRENSDVLLLIIGPPEPDKKDSVNLDIVEKFGIKDNVLFLGQRTDIDEIYPLMDIFVLPSYREGFPRSILEASALARPIIATDIRGTREAIDNNKTGILVPIGDSEKLANAIIYFLKNPDKAKQMGARARVKALKEFNERSVFSKLIRAYRRLLSLRV